VRRLKNREWVVPPRNRHILRTFTRVHELHAVGVHRQEFLKTQLEKLAVNAVIGPLSVIFDCFNDKLLHNYHVSQIIKTLTQEISAVLIALPELKDFDKRLHLFGPERLQALVVSVCKTTGANRSAMLLDVMQGKRTEIDYYSGYLLMRAEQLGIYCPSLEMTLAAVKGKQTLKEKENQENSIPFQY